MSEIQRWELIREDQTCFDVHLRSRPNGSMVTYKDHLSALATAKREVLEECLELKMPQKWFQMGRTNTAEALREGWIEGWEKYADALRSKLKALEND